MNKKRYLGSFFANDFLVELVKTRTFIKGKLESVPARPVKYHSIFNRVYQAFDVLRGKADALYWWEDFEIEEDRLEPSNETCPDCYVKGGKVFNCNCGECF